jgi:hypothetical protein
MLLAGTFIPAMLLILTCFAGDGEPIYTDAELLLRKERMAKRKAATDAAASNESAEQEVECESRGIQLKGGQAHARDADVLTERLRQRKGFSEF